MEFAPYLQKHAEVDFLISGHSAELKFPFDFKYRYHGIYFIFGKKGGVNYLESIKSQRPFTFIKDVRSCPVGNYDAVVNDFEPVSAWSAFFKKTKCIAVSHQASFYSEKVPRHKQRNKLVEWGMKKFAPFNHCVGTHYKAYDNNIFLPIIRKELLEATVTEGQHITVYLPAFSDEILIEQFRRLPEETWKIYSKKTGKAYSVDNVQVFPVNRTAYSRDLLSAKAVVIGSGFQGTSEALYLRKKLLTIPMFDQYEQLCNAAALEELGVRVVNRIDDNFQHTIRDWLEGPNACSYHFEPQPEKMVERILSLV